MVFLSQYLTINFTLSLPPLKLYLFSILGTQVCGKCFPWQPQHIVLIIERSSRCSIMLLKNMGKECSPCQAIDLGIHISMIPWVFFKYEWCYLIYKWKIMSRQEMKTGHPVAVWRVRGHSDVHMVLLFTIITSARNTEWRKPTSFSLTQNFQRRREV